MLRTPSALRLLPFATLAATARNLSFLSSSAVTPHRLAAHMSSPSSEPSSELRSATQDGASLVAVAESTLSQALKHLSQIQTTSVEWKYSGRWLRSGNIHYSLPDGTAKSWELVERTTRLSDVGVDGVDIVAFLGNQDKTSPAATKDLDKAIILVVNYRPPIGKPSLEFPAGLIDKNETPSQAALRELKEETGFTGKIRSISDPINVDPWKSTENFHMVIIDVDGSDPSNASLKLELDEDENLVPIILPLRGLLPTLISLRAKYNLAIEGKLYGFAQALSMTESAAWK